jgi:serine/threonine protein kinase/tetratricopeptide (TPR) repeat protein
MEDQHPPASANAPTVTGFPSSAQPGATVGPYHLLQRLGEGGMGEVWLAEQTRPVHRSVALKIIKAGMDTAQVIARFEAERQALAVMDHPGIATVFDGGSTPEGRPYFAMEYVKGEPITAYADRYRLSTAARLDLFICVCEAVQHAHQKGVIHRDLKPSNVLVTLQDDHPVPKIIDFGVAKATTQHLTERSLFTELGVLIGTPEYMSPEQAELTGLDIDTRTDVYALGVLLYELLTGALPLDRKLLRDKGLDELRRTIREVEPTRPSTRITQQGPASTEAAKHRHTEPARLASQLRGDLDWITMKALEKDRTRRYDTALGLANDVRRHLRNEPVLAGPPSAAYRTKKFVRRHRFGVGAAATFVLLLVALAVTMTIQAQRIARERDRANREATVARQVSEFLVGMFKGSDPFEGRGRELTAREVLDRGSQRMRTELRDQPEVRATLMDTMGRVYLELGKYDTAAQLAEEALRYREGAFGRDSLEVASTLNSMGAIKGQQGAFIEAERMLLEALDIQRRRLGQENPRVAETLLTLGEVRYASGDWPGAERTLRESLGMYRKVVGSDDLWLANALNDLALVLERLSKREECEALYRESLAIRRKRLGNDHPYVAQTLNNIALLYSSQGKAPQAEPLLQEALVSNRKAFGDIHPAVGTNLSNLALVYRDMGNLLKAEEYCRKVVELDTQIFGENNPSVAGDIQMLGGVLKRQKKLKEAESAFRKALQIKLKHFPSDHWQVATTKNLLGDCLMDEEDYTAAEPLLIESAGIIMKQFGGSHERTQAATTRVVTLYERWGKPTQAAEWRAKLPKEGAGK